LAADAWNKSAGARSIASLKEHGIIEIVRSLDDTQDGATAVSRYQEQTPPGLGSKSKKFPCMINRGSSPIAESALNPSKYNFC